MRVSPVHKAVFVAAVICLGLNLTLLRAGQGRTLRKELQQALQAEAAGVVTDRAELLQSSLKLTRANNPARWQAGFLREGNRWVKFDQLQISESDAQQLEEYHVQRAAAPDTYQGRLRLADWCRKHRLLDQERAHLLEALDHQNQSSEVLGRLGYRRIGGAWLSSREQQMLLEERTRQSVALKKWLSRLTKIARDLESDSAGRQQSAAKRLCAINDPDAVLAMRHTLFGGRATSTLAAVRALQGMTSFEAAQLLVELAVAADDNRIRQAATSALKEKPREQSVPELLGQLSTPTEVGVEMRYRNGRAFVRQVYHREEQYQRRAAIVDSRLLSARGGRRNRRGGINAIANQRFLNDFNRDQQTLTNQINVESAQRNERVFQVLHSITDAEVPDDPRSWWKWWNSEQDVEVTSKPYEYRSYERNLDPRPPESCECLLAGTPVWTEQGLRSVEEIRSGDRVLSKDVETGELMLKPVLRPTERPAQALQQVVLKGGETIVCTEGHPFWVSGRGWTLVKDFAPGDILHTVTGAHQVQRVDSGPMAESYNLVVDDFHTYFVGRAMVLSHDNTIRKPTNAVVPGLMRNQVRVR